MISFNCSCGKKYQLPDRVGGREVRCNQCQKTLLVPKQSQDEPVVPLDDLKTTEQPPKAEVRSNETIPPPLPEKSPDKPLQSDRSQNKKIETDPTNSAWGDVPLPQTTSENDDAQKTRSTGKINSEGQNGDLSVLEEKPKRTFSLGTFLLLLATTFITALVFLLIGYLLRGAMNGDSESYPARREIVSGFALHEQDPEPDNSVENMLVPVAKKEYSFRDWKVEGEPITFTAKTADGKNISLTLDGNPVEASSGSQKEDVLSVVASAISDENDPSSASKHMVSLKVRSESPKTLRIIWPGEQPTQLDGSKIKEFQFSFYISDKSNAAFKPGKPDGIDKVLELADFSLRLCAETGYVEFIPTDKDKLISFVEKARKNWQSIQIPIDGNENWKRFDHGLVGPLNVQRIELHARPTGSGVVFWIDNLNIATD